MAEPGPESGPEGRGPTAQDSGGRGARHGASVPRLHSHDGRGAFQGLNEMTLSVLGSTLPVISQVSTFVPSVFTAYSPRSRHWAGCGVATGDKASLCTVWPCDKGNNPRSLSGGASHVTSTAPGGWALPVRLTGEEVKAQVHSGTCRTRPGRALPPCEHPALLRPPAGEGTGSGRRAPLLSGPRPLSTHLPPSSTAEPVPSTPSTHIYKQRPAVPRNRLHGAPRTCRHLSPLCPRAWLPSPPTWTPAVASCLPASALGLAWPEQRCPTELRHEPCVEADTFSARDHRRKTQLSHRQRRR